MDKMTEHNLEKISKLKNNILPSLNKENKPIVIGLCGLPCTGKTTFRNSLLNANLVDHVLSSDDIIEDLSKTVDMAYNEGFEHFIDPASKIVKKKAAIFSYRNSNVVWDQTFLDINSRQRIFTYFPNHFKVIFYFEKKLEDIFEMNTLRYEKTGKYINKKIIEEMSEKYQRPMVYDGFDCCIPV